MAKLHCQTGDWFGCNWYRIHEPFRELNRRGHSCTADDHSPNEDFNIVVLQRPHSEVELGTIQRLKKRGIKTAFELDDDVFGIDPKNPAHGYYTMEVLGWLVKCMSECDIVTTTTQDLAQKMKDRGAREVYILPNALPDEYWTFIRQPTPNIVSVGWAGSLGHMSDLEIIKDLFEQSNKGNILDKYTHVQFLMAGMGAYPWPQHPKGIILPPTLVPDYGRMVLSRFDIGLAPLADNAFNLAKSDLKVIELTAAGCPVICSPIGPYLDWKDGEEVIYASTKDEWADAIDWLVKDVDARERLVNTCRKRVKDRVMSKMVVNWERAYGLEHQERIPVKEEEQVPEITFDLEAYRYG